MNSRHAAIRLQISYGEFTMTIYGAGGVRPDPITDFYTADPQFSTALADAGDPEKAPNGTVAAQDLLDPNNPYFDKLDPNAREVRRAEEFVAVISNYLRNNDIKDLAQFLNTLGPDKVNMFKKEADNLTYPPENDQGNPVVPVQQIDSLVSQAELKVLAYDLGSLGGASRGDHLPPELPGHGRFPRFL
jgi:hypothetical protein